MFRKLSRYYHTLKNLKLIQIRYQVWYRLRNRFFPVQYPKDIKVPKFQILKLDPFPDQYIHYFGDKCFQFLNIEQSFKNEINWNYLGHGKLWAYHLNYFDYLHQPQMDWKKGKVLVESFLQDLQNRPEGMEPYPISLRTINWIKFLAKYERYPQEILDSLYAQYQVLSKKIEYHLLGNHLLENGFSLLFGSVFFQDEKLVSLTRKILKAELEEQILEDGAHFELSPMYHVILLQRALDGYNLLKNNKHQFQDLQDLLQEVIQKMVNWLHSVMFVNGDIPMVNDSTDGQGLKPKVILSYAQQFGFTPQNIELKESGYRKFKAGDFEMVVDVGEVGPNYQPGHAHSDTLSFVLYYNGEPIIVDRGISTYEKNQTREIERGTASHNTVMINNQEQTDVWGGFRVGRRAMPVIITDEKDHLKATHNGYNNLGLNHIRHWSINESEVVIKDEIRGKETEATAYIHLHPDAEPTKIEEGVFRLKNLIFRFEAAKSVSLEPYYYCTGFNNKKEAFQIRVVFENDFQTRIRKENNLLSKGIGI